MYQLLFYMSNQQVVNKKRQKLGHHHGHEAAYGVYQIPKRKVPNKEEAAKCTDTVSRATGSCPRASSYCTLLDGVAKRSLRPWPNGWAGLCQGCPSKEHLYQRF